MPVIRIRISASHNNCVAAIPAEFLGATWPHFVQALRSVSGFIPDAPGTDPQAPAERCADLCNALRRSGFTLTGSPAALELARQQGYRPAAPQAPAQTLLQPFPAAAEACPITRNNNRQAQTDLERWAQAGLNILMSARGKGAGPGKFDRPGLTALYVRLCDGTGLLSSEWEKLCKQLRKYHKQIGNAP